MIKTSSKSLVWKAK